MPTWSTEYLERLQKEAEREISRQVNFVWEKYSLAVTAGTANYVLPDYVRGIIDVRWKGEKVYPLVQEEAKRLDPSYITSRGKVEYYLRSPEDFQYIRFIKVPNETITADAADDLYDSSVLDDRVVITFYREANAEVDIIALPDYAGRRLIRDWVAYRAFMSEGAGQNLKASAFYKRRYQDSLFWYKFGLEQQTQKKILLSGRTELDMLRHDLPNLRSDFTITPGPYPLNQGITDSINNFADEIIISLGFESGVLLAEDGTPLLAEDGTPILVEP